MLAFKKNNAPKKVVTAIAEKENIEFVREVLEIFKDKLSSLKIGAPKIGELKDKVIITFGIEASQYSLVVEKLVFNNIKVITNDPATKKVVEKASSDLAKMDKVKGNGWDDVNIEKSKLTIDDIQEFAKNGKYVKLIKVIKTAVNHDVQVVEKAKFLLDPTIERIIKTTFEEAQKSIVDANKPVMNLIKLATDSHLRNFNKLKMQTEAGFKAIEICLLNSRLHKYLLDIVNNSLLPFNVNIQAALKIEELIEEEKIDKNLMENLVKSLNIRWIDITLDTAGDKVSLSDRQRIFRLINFIKEKRKSF